MLLLHYIFSSLWLRVLYVCRVVIAQFDNDNNNCSNMPVEILFGNSHSFFYSGNHCVN